MLHYLFNNIFIENPNNKSQNLQIKDNLAFPINDENDLILFSMLDIFDKAQQLFSVGAKNNQEYADIVNYIELNLSQQEKIRKYLFVIFLMN